MLAALGCRAELVIEAAPRRNKGLIGADQAPIEYRSLNEVGAFVSIYVKRRVPMKQANLNLNGTQYSSPEGIARIQNSKEAIFHFLSFYGVNNCRTLPGLFPMNTTPRSFFWECLVLWANGLHSFATIESFAEEFSQKPKIAARVIYV